MKTLIVIKHSKYEWEMMSSGITHSELLQKYSSEHANLDAIMKGHEKQLAARRAMETAFPDATFCFLSDKLSDPNVYDIVLVLGGDNSFTKVSHHIRDVLFMGINSDPERSSGHLLAWSINSPHDAYNLKSMLDNQDYQVEEWTRLSATVDGKKILSATSEYFLGEKMRDKMSRHTIEYRGKSYEQKCSGLLIATGIGSTGWYKHAVINDTWPPRMKLAQFGITEIFEPNEEDRKMGTLLEQEELVVHSLNDDDGCVSVDSWDRYDFHRGSTARIQLGSPLKTIIPNKGK